MDPQQRGGFSQSQNVIAFHTYVIFGRMLLSTLRLLTR
jgi:hypothetical protein